MSESVSESASETQSVSTSESEEASTSLSESVSESTVEIQSVSTSESWRSQLTPSESAFRTVRNPISKHFGSQKYQLPWGVCSQNLYQKLNPVSASESEESSSPWGVRSSGSVSETQSVSTSESEEASTSLSESASESVCNSNPWDLKQKRVNLHSVRPFRTCNVNPTVSIRVRSGANFTLASHFPSACIANSPVSVRVRSKSQLLLRVRFHLIWMVLIFTRSLFHCLKVVHNQAYSHSISTSGLASQLCSSKEHIHQISLDPLESMLSSQDSHQKQHFQRLKWVLKRSYLAGLTTSRMAFNFIGSLKEKKITLEINEEMDVISR